MYAAGAMAANAKLIKFYSIMTRTVYVKPWRCWKTGQGGYHDGRWAAEPEMEQLLNPAVLTTLAVLTAASASTAPMLLANLYTDTFTAVLWIRLDPLDDKPERSLFLFSHRRSKTSAPGSNTY